MKRIGTFLISAALVGLTAFSGIGNVTKNVTDVRAETIYDATPKLLITGRDIKGDEVKAGDEFEMTIHLVNESNSTKLRNISLKLSSEENQIVTASGSDTLYIDKIDKEGEYDVTVKMKARADLPQNNYTVNVDYSYENTNKNTFEDSASLSIPVVQESKISISEKKLSKSEVSIDGKTSLTFKVNNMGLDKLRNVTATFSGDDIDDLSYYVGTIEAGENSSVDMTITPAKVGEDPIDIEITYEDTSGNTKKFNEEISLVVTEEVAEAEAVETAAVSPAYIGVGAVVILLLIVIFSTIIKKVNQKKYE